METEHPHISALSRCEGLAPKESLHFPVEGAGAPEEVWTPPMGTPSPSSTPTTPCLWGKMFRCFEFQNSEILKFTLLEKFGNSEFEFRIFRISNEIQFKAGGVRGLLHLFQKRFRRNSQPILFAYHLTSSEVLTLRVNPEFPKRKTFKRFRKLELRALYRGAPRCAASKIAF